MCSYHTRTRLSFVRIPWQNVYEKWLANNSNLMFCAPSITTFFHLVLYWTKGISVVLIQLGLCKVKAGHR